MPSFYVHGYEEQVAEEEQCCRCSLQLKGRGAYAVSYDGVVAKYRVCSGCKSWLESAFGVRGVEGGAGKPAVEGVK